MAKELEEVEYPDYHFTPGDDVILDNDFGNYHGGAGNDVFIAIAEEGHWSPEQGETIYMPDVYLGGSGTDTVSYVSSNTRIEASLQTGIANRMFGAYVQSTDYLDSIENMIGSIYSDHLYGSSAANRLSGGNGNDVINGYAGNDTLLGDDGNDTLGGGDGNDALEGGSGNDNLLGGNGNDAMDGDGGRDHLEGGAGNDSLNGGSGNDALLGGDGYDTLEGGSGNDTLDGGGGTDTAIYTGAGAVTVNLWLGTASGAMGNDTLVNIERVETGDGNDVVFGSYGANTLSSGGGNDTVYAFDGHDIVNSGSGNDKVDGYEGNDLLNAGSGNDRVWGNLGNDEIHGESGNDVLIGGSGDDVIYGDSGNDLMRGGDGQDDLYLGTGADVVSWDAGDSGADWIGGFNLADDRLNFQSGFFAQDPVGAIDLRDVLQAVDIGGGIAMLVADTAEEGWTTIGAFTGVNAHQMNAMIANESILAVNVAQVGGGAMGDVIDQLPTGGML